MRKLTAAVFALFFALSSVAYASEAEDMLKGLDIAEENYTFTDSMTRGDFAVMLANVFSRDSFDYSGENYFSDVNAKALGKKAAGGINKAASYGILKGTGSEFSPERKITSDEAAAALVRMLGYENTALSNGGYPDGYVKTAAQIGLYKSAAGGNEGENIAVMIKNALECDVVRQSAYNKYEVESGKNLLEAAMDVYKVSGELAAVGKTAVSQDTSIGENFALIGSSELLFDEDDRADLRSLLGENIDAYYKKQTTDDDKLLYYRSSGKSNVIKFKINSDTKLSPGEVTYSDENGKIKTKTIANAPYIVYNNRAIGYIPSEIGSAGYIRLVGSGGKYDTVIIEDYRTYVVQNVSLANKKIISKYDEAALPDMDKPSELYIHDTEGNNISLESIKSGDVLSVLRSADDDCIDISVCRKTVYGRIDGVTKGEFDDYRLNISAYLYEVTEGMYNKLKDESSERLLAVTGDFSLDMFGRIADFTYGSSSKRHIGFMVKVINDTDAERVKIKVFTPSGSFEETALSSRLKVNDVSTAPEEFARKYNERQLITYAFDGSGEINRIYCAVDLDENSSYSAEGLYRINSTPLHNLYYRGEHKSFNSSVIADSSLVAFVIPSSSEDMTNDNYYVAETLNNFSGGTEYNNMTFYKTDPQSLTANIIVRTRDFRGFYNDDTPVLVDHFSSALSSDGDVVEMLSAHNESGSVAYAGRSDVSLKTVQSGADTVEIKKGDIVRCAVNPLGEAGRIEILYSFENDKYYASANPVIKDTNQSYRYGLGNAEKRDGDIIKVKYRSGTIEYFDIRNSKILVVTKDASGKTLINDGDISDIISSEGQNTPSELFIYSPRNNPVVIYVYNK